MISNQMFKSLIHVLLLFSLLTPISRVRASLSFSDILSDTRPGFASDHLFKWSTGDVVNESEGFDLIFADSFQLSSITAGDALLTANGQTLALGSGCSGSVLSFSVSDNTVSITLCPGQDVIASGTLIAVKIGQNAGGSHQIINPSILGGHTISLSGRDGYNDWADLQVAMLNGTVTSLTIGPRTGALSLNGYASPNSLVVFNEGESVIGTTSANSGSYFEKNFSGLVEGIHTISLYAVDAGQYSTLSVSFSLNVYAGTTTTLSGIILPPSFNITDIKVKRPAVLNGGGWAKDNATVQVFIVGIRDDDRSFSVPVASSGQWSANLNPKLHLGNKLAYSMVLDGHGGQSLVSGVKNYEVLVSADLNLDNKVNLFDFSTLMYNFAVSQPSNVAADINDNGNVDLVDFSYMMFRWTGG